MVFYLSMESSKYLLSAWESALHRCGGGAAALFSSSGEALRTYQEISDEAAAWAARFRAFGVVEGSVVGLQVPNRPEWPALFLALLECGAVALPLGGHLGGEERGQILAGCQASAYVALSEGRLEIFPSAVDVAKGGVEWEGARPALLKLTSGTTAAPRAIRFTARQLAEDGLQICETMGIGAGDLNYGVIPINHSYGFSNLLMPLLLHGVPMVVSDDPMPRAILNGLCATGATVFPGMPLLFDKLAALEGAAAMPGLRLCISAGAPLTPEVARRFYERFSVKVHSFYGSSESGGIAFDASDTVELPAGYVGKPMSRVCLHPREGGSFQVESGAVGDGYWPASVGGQEEECALAGGRFTPSDLARITPDGVYLVGRVSDIINIAGRKLNPGEVESVLRQCPGVDGVLVFGVPSTLRGEEAVACVVGAVAQSELLGFARSRLAGWQVPKAVWFVGEIPVNERGKTNRRVLAQQYLAMQGSPPRS